jgi:hypothetical protein
LSLPAAPGKVPDGRGLAAEWGEPLMVFFRRSGGVGMMPGQAAVVGGVKA